MTTRKKVTAAVRPAAARARVAGRKAAERMAVAADAKLVEAGQAAKHRQRGRAIKRALKTATRAAAIAAATATTIMAARAAARARRRRGAPAAP
jgi:hypothetical protein